MKLTRGIQIFKDYLYNLKELIDDIIRLTCSKLSLKQVDQTFV